MGVMIKELETFLSQFHRMWKESLRLRYESYLMGNPENFLGMIKAEIRKVKVIKKKEAPCFNPFLVLRIEKRELSATSLWSDLLNPNGWHEQDDLFLKPFLALIDRKQKRDVRSYAETSLSHWESEKEFVFRNGKVSKENGRIDILLSNIAYDYAIAIEYKIKADDQPNQIERYHEYLTQQKFQQSELVYITANGESPSDKSCADKKICDGVICLSIRRDLARIIRETIDDRRLAPRVKEFLKYYLEVIGL